MRSCAECFHIVLQTQAVRCLEVAFEDMAKRKESEFSRLIRTNQGTRAWYCHCCALLVQCYSKSAVYCAVYCAGDHSTASKIHTFGELRITSIERNQGI